MKFGGAVLHNAGGFRQMSAILSSLAVPAVVVVSAFADSTRLLEAAAIAARDGNQEQSIEIARSVIENNRRIAYSVLSEEIAADTLGKLIDDCARQLENVLRGVAITRQLTDRTLDLIRSFGEFLALHIVRHYLEKSGISTIAVDAADLIVTDNRHGAAEPLVAPTKRRLDRIFPEIIAKYRVVVIQGYVARGASGEITTMGKESSNLTATLLAEALCADESVIWTDVQGIFSADPHIVPEAVPIAVMSLRDAELAARNGAKPLYATMIEPAQRSGIPIVFRSALRPDGYFTVIGGDQDLRPKMITIASCPDAEGMSAITLLHITPIDALAALRNIPTELLGDLFTLEIGVKPDIQRVILPAVRANDIVRFFHREIIEPSSITADKP